MKHDLIYDGQKLSWHGHGRFKASSGMPGFQAPRYQCMVDKGPTPEGRYLVYLTGGGMAEVDFEYCTIKPSRGLQVLPGPNASMCAAHWANWGWNRIRFEAADEATAARCRTARTGFYLHDSIKGYSHGCIEVESLFFDELRGFLWELEKKKQRRTHLSLEVRYVPGQKTNGGTALEARS